METSGIGFSEKYSGGIGTLTINGLILPRTAKFDPLVKIWTTVKKRVFERAGLDVIGIFIHDVEQELIVGNFYLSFVGVKEKDINQHIAKFEESFPRQMQLFEDTLIKFLESDIGYSAYLEALEANVEASFADVFNDFLRATGVRTRSVERLAKDHDQLIAKFMEQNPSTTKNPAC